MKKFQFRLEAVRRLREQEEQLVQSELAAVLRERRQLEFNLAESRAAEDSIYAHLRQDELSGAQFAHISQYGALHRRRILDITVTMQHCDERIGRVRTRLAEARAKREALDKLRKRHHEDHRKRWLEEEIRELDEIGSQRSRRYGALTSGGRA